MTFSALQWICMVAGAFLAGVAKTAIGGLGAVCVALFTAAIPSKQASGLVLPLLIFGDFIAVFAYRRHTQWRYVWKLLPWTALGVVLGYFALGRMSDHTTRITIGCIILGLAAINVSRRALPQPDANAPVHWSIAIVVGILAGFVTLVANAAGALMAIYLVEMRLPKLQYVGTTAVFFLLLNLFKVPFMTALGLITVSSLKLNLVLLPAVLVGAVAGRWLLTRINQRWFEGLVLGMSALAGLLLVL